MELRAQARVGWGLSRLLRSGSKSAEAARCRVCRVGIGHVTTHFFAGAVLAVLGGLGAPELFPLTTSVLHVRRKSRRVAAVGLFDFDSTWNLPHRAPFHPIVLANFHAE
jgi:hypothetical protein